MVDQRPSLRALLIPQPTPWRFVALLACGIALGWVIVAWARLPIWGASILALALIAWPTLQTWRSVGLHFEMPIMVLSILLYLQGFHFIEHIAQYIEFHVLHWPPRQATGLLSGLNVEIVHFVWNWSVLIVAVYLLRARLRSGPGNLWGWLFVGWALAHTAEHTYLMYQYIAKVWVLWATGASLSFAEGLPGVLGNRGWLETHADTNAVASFVCRLVPSVTFTPRLDVHFWWNVGETILMLAFAYGALRRVWGRTTGEISNASPAANQANYRLTKGR